MIRSVLVLFTVVGLAAIAHAGPFGLEKGMSLAQLGNPKRAEQPGAYQLTSVPKPHNAFEAYLAIVSPTMGLCKITAVGKTIESDSQGFALRSAFSDMKAKLAATYGAHKTNDFLYPGSIWNEPQDWMMALVKKERVLAAFWDVEEHSTLSGGLTSIMLQAKPLGSGTGYLVLSYEFDGVDRCLAEVNAAQDKAL